MALLLGFATAAASAGPLNPPAGPITSTHKTLTEVEPRIPISSTTTPGDATSLYRISQPGSYYLTGNITGQAGKHGIYIVGLGNRIEDNHVARCQGTGIRTETSGNVIIRNTARSNATNYHFVGSQIAGPIITGVSPITDSVSPWANFAW